MPDNAPTPRLRRRATGPSMTLEAVRMRAYRRRLGRGQKVAPLPFDDDIVGYLIDARLLPPEGEASRLEIGQAAFKALVRIAKSQA